MNKITPIFLLLLLISCVMKKSKADYEKEVSLLTETSKQQVFLENIYDLDQKVRKDVDTIEIQYGYESKERKEAVKRIVKIDVINLQKIELYLEQYGHPTIKVHGKKASSTPWIVIHHSGTIEARERNFRYLYSAYKNENLRSGSFSMYLNRFYSMRYGERFTLPNPYREEEMIHTLLTCLDLDTEMPKFSSFKD